MAASKRPTYVRILCRMHEECNGSSRSSTTTRVVHEHRLNGRGEEEEARQPADDNTVGKGN
jgi:hypothetical protein